MASRPPSLLAAAPDNINWPTLWCPWQQVWLRAVLVVLPLTIVMLFPIGALTGALSNLDMAVCGGTPGGLPGRPSVASRRGHGGRHMRCVQR